MLPMFLTQGEIQEKWMKLNSTENYNEVFSIQFLEL